MQQAFHHFHGAVAHDPGRSSRLTRVFARPSRLGVWKDKNVRHEVIQPDLVGNGGLPAEIVES
jgi:hypothetical protein